MMTGDFVLKRQMGAKMTDIDDFIAEMKKNVAVSVGFLPEAVSKAVEQTDNVRVEVEQHQSGFMYKCTWPKYTHSVVLKNTTTPDQKSTRMAAKTIAFWIKSKIEMEVIEPVARQMCAKSGRDPDKLLDVGSKSSFSWRLFCDEAKSVLMDGGQP